MSKRQPYTDVKGRELQASQGVEMDRKSLIEVASALKPGDRLEWIRHIKGSPTHVVIAIGIRTIPAMILAGVLAYKVMV